MTRLSYVFLFVAVSTLNCVVSEQRLSDASEDRDNPLDAVVASESSPLKEVECGISGANINERIVGGEEAKPHAWPWQVLLNCVLENEGSICGGSLIDEKWVITAAHCLYRGNGSKFNKSECSVVLGMHRLPNSTEVEPGVTITGIESYFIHEQYNKLIPLVGYDIALLKLDKTVQFGDTIKPICLPFDLHENVSCSRCYATGWGRDVRDEPVIAKALKQLKMQVQDCNLYSKAILFGAFSMNFLDDVCYGDSGGPLACRDADGKWYLRGVTSFGPCDGCYSWAAFTKVAAFRDWITEKTITKRAY